MFETESGRCKKSAATPVSASVHVKWGLEGGTVGEFRGEDDRELERRLRGLREEPSNELIDSIAAKVGTRRPRAWSRGVFATSFATVVLGTFASLGGVGYAASGAQQTLKAVAKTTHIQTAASSQYKHPKVVKVAAAAKTVRPLRAVKGQTLPFTGYSLVWTSVGGLVLLIAGFGLRRREQRR
jgi:hypothetical protein